MLDCPSELTGIKVEIKAEKADLLSLLGFLDREEKKESRGVQPYELRRYDADFEAIRKDIEAGTIKTAKDVRLVFALIMPLHSKEASEFFERLERLKLEHSLSSPHSQLL